VVGHRVIPCLLLEHGGLVKTRQFRERTYVGDPINAVRIFNDKEVDELIVLDIAASRESAEPDYELIQTFATECFIPLCYGGGIKSIAHARRLFSLGVEKLCIQSAALERPAFISELAKQFGSQSIVVSIDVKRNWLGQLKLYESRTRKLQRKSWFDFLDEAVHLGAGEIVLNSVDRDGMMTGYDVELINRAAARISVPLIALGGAGELEHFKQAIAAGATAVAAGSMFVFQGPHRAVLINYPDYGELERLFEVSK
jgi:imidazole glycerol-phosphate synthase subunit HisF